MEQGCADRCPGWHRFLLAHYDDVTTRWNGMLEDYAREHPGGRCSGRSRRRPATRMCLRAMTPSTREPARPDGTHYEGAGQERVVTLLMEYLTTL